MFLNCRFTFSQFKPYLIVGLIMVNAFQNCGILGIKASEFPKKIFKCKMKSLYLDSIGAGIRNLETIDFFLSIKRIRQTTSGFTTIFAVSLASDETTVVV